MASNLRVIYLLEPGPDDDVKNPVKLDPKKDAVACAGVYLQVDDNGPLDTGVSLTRDPTTGELLFSDSRQPPVGLSTLVAGGLGNTIVAYTGPNVPDPGLGKNGDLAFNQQTKTLYGPKKDGLWAANSAVTVAGTAGRDGATGAPGVAGAPGSPGSLIISCQGSGPPSPSIGSDRDYAVNTDEGVLYGPKSSGINGAWPLTPAVRIKGTPGDPGQAGKDGKDGQAGAAGQIGPSGPQGLRGALIQSGSGAPADSIGVSSDYYLDKDAALLYGPKTTTWPTSGLSVRGAKGDTGAPANPAPLGTDAMPGYAFLDHPGTGFTYDGTSKLGFSVEGVNQALIDAGGVLRFSVTAADKSGAFIGVKDATRGAGVALGYNSGTADPTTIGSQIISYTGKPLFFGIGGTSAGSFGLNLAYSAGFRLGVGSNALGAATLSVFGGTTIGGNLAGTEAPPANGVLVQGNADFRGSVKFATFPILTDITIKSAVSRNLTLSCDGSNTATPNLRTIGTYSAALGLNNFWAWDMSTINAINGVDTIVYRLSLLGDGNGNALLSWNNTYSNYNIFKYNDGNGLFSFAYDLAVGRKFSAGSTSVGTATAWVNGGLAVGGGYNATATPTNGLAIQGDAQFGSTATFNDKVTFKNGVAGLTVAATFPLIAPTGTAASPNIAYQFNGSSTSGLGYDATNSAVVLYANNIPAINVVNNSLGLGGCIPTDNAEIPLQFNAPANFARGMAWFNQGTLASLIEYNNFNGNGFPINGLWFRSYKAGDSLYFSTANTTAGQILYGLKIAPTGFVSVGSSTTSLSPMGVFGGLAIGSGVAGTTAAPVNGLLVQGLAKFNGPVSFPGGIGAGGATPNTNNVFFLGSATSGQVGIDPGEPTIQVATKPGIAASFSIIDDANTTVFTKLAYNLYTAQGVPVGTQLYAGNSKPLMFVVGNSYSNVGGIVYNVSNNYFWSVGGSAQSLSTLGVNGGLGVGSGVYSATAAPANGILSQGSIQNLSAGSLTSCSIGVGAANTGFHTNVDQYSNTYLNFNVAGQNIAAFFSFTIGAVRQYGFNFNPATNLANLVSSASATPGFGTSPGSLFLASGAQKGAAYLNEGSAYPNSTWSQILTASGSTPLATLTVTGVSSHKGGVGFGAAVPTAANVYGLGSNTAFAGTNLGCPTFQIQSPAGLAAVFSAVNSTGVFSSAFGYNDYTAGGTPAGTLIQALAGKPFLVAVGADASAVSAICYNVSNSYFWSFGSKNQSLSTVGVAGNLTIGSTSFSGTAAPINGLLVQGKTILGDLQVTGTVTGISSGTGAASGTVNLVNQSTNYTVTAADDGKTFCNINATAIITLTLPSAPAVGFTMSANCAAAQATSYIRLQASGSDKIQTITAITGVAGVLSPKNSGRTRGCAIQITYLGGNLWTWTGGYPYDWTAES